MKCACGRTHKTHADMVRSHDLRLMQHERDLYRARLIDEIADHHNVTRKIAEIDADVEVRRHMNGVALIILILIAPLFTGCEKVRHLTGLDRHDATPVSVPVTTAIQRELPAASGITFAPDQINGAPANVRVFVKTGNWLQASPGAWYEIPWTEAVDGRTTEYAVISFVGQGARVYNQPAAPERGIIVESIPHGAFDPGIPPQ